MQRPKPILILQMQRMGDLVLTFPLIIWLQRLYPEHPVWVVAEPRFYEPLVPLSPRTFYIPWTEIGPLSQHDYQLVLNLSHRPEAAELAGRLRSEETLGPVRDSSGQVHIRGDWQLYRASLTQNNRHNRYHWAELNGLDVVPPELMGRTPWGAPGAGRAAAAVEGPPRVGLFLGASQIEKRPKPAFWAALARELLNRGLRPLFLGGPGEAELGRHTAELLGQETLNLCGRYNLEEFLRLLETLTCFVTPDTGPMHLAAATGIATVNLSMGPVSAYETGPYQPGHHVVTAALSCVGCWQCVQPWGLATDYADEVRCRHAFSVPRLAFLVQQLVRGRGEELCQLRLPGATLYRTGRFQQLHHLERLTGPGPGAGRTALSRLWRVYFGLRHGLFDEARLTAAQADLASEHPRLGKALSRALAHLAARFSKALRSADPVLPEDFWAAHPPLIRPLTGYLHLTLQNENYSRAAYARALADIARLGA